MARGGGTDRSAHFLIIYTEPDKSDVYAGERKNRERTWVPMTTKAF